MDTLPEPEGRGPNAGQEPEVIGIPLVWAEADMPPVLFANQFVVQYEGGDFVIGFGQATSPILLGLGDERLEEARRISFVPIRMVGRYILNRKGMIEFMGVLQTLLNRFPSTDESKED